MAVNYKKYLMASRKPLFIHCHGYDVFWDLRDVKTPDILCYKNEYITSIIELSSIATFIANSKFTINKLLEIGIPEKKIQLKYFGVPVPAQREFNDNDSYLNILYLGRLVDFKGPDIVIKAFNSACERGLNANLIIAGDGPLKISCELLKRASKFSDRIQLLGEVRLKYCRCVKGKYRYLYGTQLQGILTHQEEAFGVSIIEAMAAGLPVISAKSGALTETVINGETGILVEQFDIESHSEAFLALAFNQSLRRKMGQNAAKKGIGLFYNRI